MCKKHSYKGQRTPKRNQNQQCIKQRKLRNSSNQLKRLHEQQRAILQELRKLSTNLKRLEQEVHRRESKKTGDQDIVTLGQVGDILQDGMRQWVTGILR